MDTGNQVILGPLGGSFSLPKFISFITHFVKATPAEAKLIRDVFRQTYITHHVPTAIIGDQVLARYYFHIIGVCAQHSIQTVLECRRSDPRLFEITIDCLEYMVFEQLLPTVLRERCLDISSMQNMLLPLSLYVYPEVHKTCLACYKMRMHTITQESPMTSNVNADGQKDEEKGDLQLNTNVKNNDQDGLVNSPTERIPRSGGKFSSFKTRCYKDPGMFVEPIENVWYYRRHIRHMCHHPGFDSGVINMGTNRMPYLDYGRCTLHTLTLTDGIAQHREQFDDRPSWVVSGDVLDRMLYRRRLEAPIVYTLTPTLLIRSALYDYRTNYDTNILWDHINTLL